MSYCILKGKDKLEPLIGLLSTTLFISSNGPSIIFGIPVRKDDNSYSVQVSLKKDSESKWTKELLHFGCNEHGNVVTTINATMFTVEVHLGGAGPFHLSLQSTSDDTILKLTHELFQTDSELEKRELMELVKMAIKPN